MDENRRQLSPYAVRPGFIVVVLGLLAVFPVLLRPFLGRASVEMHPVPWKKCVSRQHQIWVALRLYALDHGGYLPPTRVPDASGDTTAGDSWRDHLQDGYVGDEDTYVCPFGRNSREGRPRDGQPEGALGMNAVHAQPGGPEPPAHPRGQALSAIANPRELILCTDVAPDEYLLAHPSNAPGFKRTDLQATHHRGGANYLYADGHVKWLKPKQIPCTRERCAWAIQGRH